MHSVQRLATVRSCYTPRAKGMRLEEVVYTEPSENCSQGSRASQQEEMYPRNVAPLQGFISREESDFSDYSDFSLCDLISHFHKESIYRNDFIRTM